MGDGEKRGRGGGGGGKKKKGVMYCKWVMSMGMAWSATASSHLWF